ncbi:hypothetical protein [Ligilactobacillus sp. WC1T17]|uniref:hypothetical protein n=1 Tax=Ligilactobacillus sp. WC1T17 TaxID=3158786 RepID=UPI00094C38E1
MTDWTLSLATAKQYPNFSQEQKLDKLVNVNRLPGQRDFGGNMRYQTAFDLDEVQKLKLDLEQVGEVAQVKVNGHDLGQRICAPYRFDIPAVDLKQGPNDLEE